MVMMPPCVRDFVSQDARRELRITKLPHVQTESRASIVNPGEPSSRAGIPRKLTFLELCRMKRIE